MNSFSSALTTIRRSPYQSLAAILLLTVTFFLGYSFSLFAVGSERILQYFESRPQVIAFFEVDASESEIESAYEALAGQPYVSDITLVNKEKALKIYQEENRDDPLLLELVTSQILPASLEISGETLEDLNQIKKDIAGAEGVEEVVLQEDVLQTLATWTTNLRLVGLATVSLLAVTSLLIMIIIIGLKVVSKRPAILIMRIIGASRWFIRSPFIYEGILYGLLSSTFGWGMSYAGLLYLTPWLQDFLGSITIFPIPMAFFAVQYGIGTLLGILLGALAGSIAVSRVMRK